MPRKIKKNNDTKKQTVNEYIDVKDIRNNILYRKSDYAIGYLKLDKINISLLADSEIESKTTLQTAEFKSEKSPFIFMSIPRVVNMEDYLNNLYESYDNELTNPYRKMILSDMIKQATDTVISAKNFEHEFYIKTWVKVNGNEKKAEQIIKENLIAMKRRYEQIGVSSEILNDVDIIKLNNLYANGNSAMLEEYSDNYEYTPFSFIERRKVK